MHAVSKDSPRLKDKIDWTKTDKMYKYEDSNVCLFFGGGGVLESNGFPEISLD